MKIKLFLAAVCIFLLPLSFAETSNNGSSQFSAYAQSCGYPPASGKCTCDCKVDADCICDDLCNCGGTAPSNPVGPELLFMVTVAMLMWRLRA